VTTGISRPGDHAGLSLRDVADRLAIRELVDAYAYCADRRDAAGQMALFAEDADFVVYMDSRAPVPTQHLRGRHALAPVFDTLNAYQATTHFNGQSTTVLDGDTASGITYCLAHHVKVDGSARTLMIASIRYLDTFVKHGGAWLFAQRKLMVDWTETRPLATGSAGAFIEEFAMSGSKFGRMSTAAEIVADVDLHGRRAVVTGASSGIGVETARALASAGADVTLAVRNVEAGARVANEITAKLGDGSGTVRVAPLDLADLASVRDFVRSWSGPLHILVNNAGIMALPQLSRTASGYEMQFATNHLGHFALATGLHESLALADGARVVSVASIGHLFSPVVFDDLHYRFRPYDQWTSYGQSKSANVLFAVGAAQRWADDGIAVNALMPGNVASTALARHMGADDLANFGETTALALPPVKTIEQGAATSVLLAASPDVEGVTGRYYEDCAEANTVSERGTHTGGVAPYALDPNNADRLWQISNELTE
jgi:NAD(P)-dependent dehydrogenase (short-subunit alcohol dehydrogenase family)/ketosteroid isomerase-like protein